MSLGVRDLSHDTRNARCESMVDDSSLALLFNWGHPARVGRGTVPAATVVNATRSSDTREMLRMDGSTG